VHRGEVVRLRSSRAVRGREQRGERYGVILQAGDLLALSTIIVAPTSASAQAASFRPLITVAGTKTRVLVEQLTAVDHSRIGGEVGTLTWEELGAVDQALELVLGLAR
jgi:mRNA interferase MazF